MNNGQSNKTSRCPHVFYIVVIVLITAAGAAMNYMYWGMSARYEKARAENILLRNNLSDKDDCVVPRGRRA